MTLLIISLLVGGFVGYLAAIHEEPEAQECPRKGCRRMPAGQGCNHAPRTDGSASGHFHEEDGT